MDRGAKSGWLIFPTIKDPNAWTRTDSTGRENPWRANECGDKRRRRGLGSTRTNGFLEREIVLQDIQEGKEKKRKGGVRNGRMQFPRFAPGAKGQNDPRCASPQLFQLRSLAVVPAFAIPLVLEYGVLVRNPASIFLLFLGLLFSNPLNVPASLFTVCAAGYQQTQTLHSQL